VSTKQERDGAVKRDPLIGSGLHFKLPNGYINEQAVVIDVTISGNVNVGRLVLIEYFSWLTGEATTRRLIPLTELATEQWVFYASVADMNASYEAEGKFRNEQIASEEERDKPL
jgi:hypothetical protein